MNRLMRVLKHVWVKLTGLFLLPFGTVLSLSYLIYMLIIFKMPTTDAFPHKMTKHSVDRMTGKHKGW